MIGRSEKTGRWLKHPVLTGVVGGWCIGVYLYEYITFTMVCIGVGLVAPAIWLLHDLPWPDIIGYILNWWVDPSQFHAELAEKKKKEERDRVLYQKISQQLREAQERDRAYHEAQKRGRMDDDEVRAEWLKEVDEMASSPK